LSERKTLIIGIGSILRGDDGVGTRVIDELEKKPLPQGVSLERGDLSGLDLLKYLPDFERVIIIDAVDMKEKPGTIKAFKSSEIKKAGFNNMLSTHGMTLLETLALAEGLNISSGIIIVGIQPKDTSFGLELSAIIKQRIPFIANKVKEFISNDA